MKDDRLVSKMEGKTKVSRRLKQCDALTWLIQTPLYLRHFYVTASDPKFAIIVVVLCHCKLL